MEQIVELGTARLYVAISLGLLCLAFLLFYVLPAIVLGFKLRQLGQALDTLGGETQPELLSPPIADRALRQIWQKHCRTLRLVRQTAAAGTAGSIAQWGTVPAEVSFSSAAIIDDRVHRQYFRHFPSLMIGIGTLAALFNLLDVLRSETAMGLDAPLFVVATREALYLVAAATGSALVVALLERLLFSWLSTKLAAVCHKIDGLAVAAQECAGAPASPRQEEPMPLPDKLVAELRELLERSIKQQSEASDRLCQRIVESQSETELKFAAERDALAAQIAELIDNIAARSKDIGESYLAVERQLAEQVRNTVDALFAEVRTQSESLRAASAAELSTQQQVVEEARRAIEVLCTEVRSQSEQIRAMNTAELAAQQQSAEELRRSIEALYADVRNQCETIKAMGEADLATQRKIAEEARESFASLCAEARAHGETMEASTQSMRDMLAKLPDAVGRAVARISEGATKLDSTAAGIARSGEALTGAIEGSTALAQGLGRTAETLSAVTEDIGKVVADYQSARAAFAAISDSLRESVETARRGTSVNLDVSAGLEATVRKLIAAQVATSDSLERQQAAAAKTGAALDTQVPALQSATRELSSVTEVLVSAIADFRARGIEDAGSRRDGVDGSNGELEQALAELRRRERKAASWSAN